MGITTGKTNGQMEKLIIGKQKISHSANSKPMSVGEHHPAFKRVCSQVRSRLLPRSLTDFGIGLSTRAAGGEWREKLT